jgi:hypothetical protein
MFRLLGAYIRLIDRSRSNLESVSPNLQGATKRREVAGHAVCGTSRFASFLGIEAGERLFYRQPRVSGSRTSLVYCRPTPGNTWGHLFIFDAIQLHKKQ